MKRKTIGAVLILAGMLTPAWPASKDQKKPKPPEPTALERYVAEGYASVVLQNGSDLNRVRQKWVMMFP